MYVYVCVAVCMYDTVCECVYVCMYVCALQEVVSAMEKQYQHILTLLKEKEAILLRDKAVTEREYTAAYPQSVALVNVHV